MAYVETIYTYWDTAQVKQVLEGVAMLTSMDDFTGLMKIFAILGMLIAVATGFVKARGEDAANYFIMLLIFYGLLFIPKKDVVIVDATGMNGPQVVANVPIGLAFFASAESHIGHWLTKASETVYALPGELKFHQAGFMFGSRLTSERMANARFNDPEIYGSLVNFIKDCVYPEMNNSPILMKAIIHSDDIWARMGQSDVLNPGRLVSIYNKTNNKFEVFNCADAYNNHLKAAVTAQTDEKLGFLARIMNPQTPDPTIAKGMLISQLQTSDALLLGVSQTAAEGIRNAAMINLLRESTIFVPQMLGDVSSAQVAIAAAQANAQANTSYLTMAKVGESTLPLVRNGVHLLILSVFPIMMLMVIIAGSKAGQVLRMYAMVILWVNLWPPLYAVLNALGTSYTANNIQAATGGAVITFANHIPALNSTISDQGIIGMLTLSVPIIAWMLVSGSAMAASSVASGLLAPASGAAQQAGSSVGKGELSAGNVSWGNVQQGNYSSWNRSEAQWNTAPTNRHGASTSTQVYSNGAEVTSTQSNGAYVSKMPHDDVGIISGQVSNQVMRSLSEKSADAASQTTQSATDLMKGITSAYAQGSTSGMNFSTGQGVSLTGSTGGSSSRSSGFERLGATATGFEESFGLTKDESGTLTAGISGAISPGALLKGGSDILGKVADKLNDRRNRPEGADGAVQPSPSGITMSDLGGKPSGSSGGISRAAGKVAEFGEGLLDTLASFVDLKADGRAGLQGNISEKDVFNALQKYSETHGLKDAWQDVTSQLQQYQADSGSRQDTTYGNSESAQLQDLVSQFERYQSALSASQSYETAAQTVQSTQGGAGVAISKSVVDFLGDADTAAQILPHLNSEQQLRIADHVAQRLAQDASAYSGDKNYGDSASNQGIANDAVNILPPSDQVSTHYNDAQNKIGSASETSSVNGKTHDQIMTESANSGSKNAEFINQQGLNIQQKGKDIESEVDQANNAGLFNHVEQAAKEAVGVKEDSPRRID